MVNFGSTSEGAFKCLGWNIRHEQGAIIVNQSDYISNKLDYLDIEKGGRKNDDLLNEKEAETMRASIGQLRWLADQTRPDIAYDLLEHSMVAVAVGRSTV